MKALLIYPPTLNMLNTNVPDFVDTETGVYPPLGLLYIAAYARMKTNFTIEVLDCHAERMDYVDVKLEIRKRKPDVIGIQALTFTLIDALKVADIAKTIDNNIHVCVGGPHVNIYPTETLGVKSVDSVVRGEGEYVFADILNVIETGRDLKSVKGLLFKEGEKIIDTGFRGFMSNEELNELPHPARDLVDIMKYYSLLAKTNPVTTVMTSRGCPFKCIFCDRPQMGKTFRYRNADSILEELSACYEMGISEFFFYDDTFTVNKQRVMEFCDKLLRTEWNKKISWDVRSRVDTVDEEMLKAMSLAGCDRIHYGVEAGTDRILGILRKGITRERVEEVFKLTSKCKMQILAYFIVGNPGEKREEIEETISFAKRLNPDYVHFSVMTPYPGTELYQNALRMNILKEDHWKVFADRPSIDFTPPLLEENFTNEELMGFLKNAYRKFYLRPYYILQQLLKIRSFFEFKRKIKAGIRVVMC